MIQRSSYDRLCDLLERMRRQSGEQAIDIQLEDCDVIRIRKDAAEGHAMAYGQPQYLHCEKYKDPEVVIYTPGIHESVKLRDFDENNLKMLLTAVETKVMQETAELDRDNRQYFEEVMKDREKLDLRELNVKIDTVDDKGSYCSLFYGNARWLYKDDDGRLLVQYRKDDMRLGDNPNPLCRTTLDRLTSRSVDNLRKKMEASEILTDHYESKRNLIVFADWFNNIDMSRKYSPNAYSPNRFEDMKLMFIRFNEAMKDNTNHSIRLDDIYGEEGMEAERYVDNRQGWQKCRLHEIYAEPEDDLDMDKYVTCDISTPNGSNLNISPESLSYDTLVRIADELGLERSIYDKNAEKHEQQEQNTERNKTILRR